MPSRCPSSSWTTSLSFASDSSSFGGPKKSPVHSNKSNFPCLASIALTFANNSRIEPTVEPTVNLFTRQDSVFWVKFKLTFSSMLTFEKRCLLHMFGRIITFFDGWDHVAATWPWLKANRPF